MSELSIPSEAMFARWGFHDPSAAKRWAADTCVEHLVAGDAPTPALSAMSQSPDPDGALQGAVRILSTDEGRHHLGELLKAGDPRLYSVLGVSSALSDFLVRHPEQWRIGAEVDHTNDGMRRHLVGLTQDDMRVAYRGILTAIAADDLTAESPASQLKDVSEKLAYLAGAALESALAHAVARVQGAADLDFAIIGLGKTGGRELNYISDVDVMYVVQPRVGSGLSDADAIAAGSKIAGLIGQICSAPSPAGALWPVDLGLRPEGRDGPVVRTIESYRDYYRNWAESWEFQALLKARPIAGSPELGAAFVDVVSPMVWAAGERDGFVQDVRAMRSRVIAGLSPDDADRNIKLGAGGLRDVEFTVQLLQLVHGRVDASLRHRGTLTALDALVDGGYVSRTDGATFAASYTFLRALEHRAQLTRLKRTHHLPIGDTARIVARSLGLRDEKALQAAWKKTSRTVRSLHESIFYRPILEAVSRISRDELRLTADSARTRLRALGYRDAAGALNHIEALTKGVTRRAAIQRQLLPVLLEWFASEADPDAGLLNFRRVSDTLGRTHWYLGMLRDSGAAAASLAHTLASGKFVPDMLNRDPQAIAWLGDKGMLSPRPPAHLSREMAGAINRTTGSSAVGAVRAVRRREVLRSALACVAGKASVLDVGEALSSSTSIAIDAALMCCEMEVAKLRGLDDGLPIRMSIIGMGRLGGHELGFASDADVIFVHEATQDVSPSEASKMASDVAIMVQKKLKETSAEPPVLLDAALRPEGKRGPMSRSLVSYEKYYAQWSDTWEAQALLRARPVAGDRSLATRFIELADKTRYPSGGLDERGVRSIRLLKARMESERLPRGVDGRRHVKLGPGGLSDIEWVVQLATLRNAHWASGLRTPSTLEALGACETHGVLEGAAVRELREAWLVLSNARNAVTLWQGKGGDVLPGDERDVDGVARLMGLAAGQPHEAEALIMRTMRRTRNLTEDLFYS